MSDTENTHYTNVKPGSDPVPVAAIGGSAGSQQAMCELLSHLPSQTGLAYVFIQHLSPDYDSKLDVIFSAKTAMPVLEAVHLMPVEPDHLYVIPPGKAMELIDGVLVLMPRKSKPYLHLPIDQFFISLAERQKDGAIGIILSGMASDGTLGLKAIKVAGGITIVQDGTAAYQGMPLSAITEGVVDMVLSPSEIAAELSRLSKHTEAFQLTAETEEIARDDTDEQDLKTILHLVKTAVGVDFAHYKKSTIRRRIVRRMLLYKLDTLAAYSAYLRKHPTEASILYNDLLINVTNFFRDLQVMEYLKKQVLPRIIESKAPAEPVRIWVAGCSTGQEAYSLAMIMLEILGERAASVSVQIFATDLSDMAIAKARIGLFTKGEIADVSPDRRERFFSLVDNQYRVNKPVRDLCVFAPHNLLGDPPFSRMDLVSCRNLLIYLDEELQKKVFATFHYALKPNGYLLLGKSESVGSSPSFFTQIEKTQKVFVRKNSTQTKIPLNMAMKSNNPTPQFKAVTTKSTDLVSTNDLDKLVDNLLLSSFVPASVVVDQDLEIIQFRGATTPFLQHPTGKASLNLTKMAHPALVFELRNIVHKVRKTGLRARKDGLEINYADRSIYVNIEAVSITNPANQQLFLILFEQVSKAVATGWNTLDADQRVKELEAELTAVRQDMHSIVEEQEASNEELQSANEEIVSSNEELQSINEELETSKEEIESANEELQTINHELQVRNDQLTESYEYSEAILSTINEATLVLDENLRIKSANSAFYKFFETEPDKTEDQLIYEFGNRQLDFPQFRDLLHQVTVHNTEVKGLEASARISATEHRTMVIHVRKLTLHQKQIILLGFEDITAYRREQKLLQERKQWFEDLVDSAPAMMWVCQTDGKINFLNKAWIRFTGQILREGETNFYDAIHPEDLRSYQDIFSENFPQQTEFSIEYRLRRSDGEYRWLLENAKPVFSFESTFTGYTGSSVEIHLQKTLTQQLDTHVREKTAELKLAHEELIEVAKSLQAVLDSSPASIAFFKTVVTSEDLPIDFVLVVCNQKFAMDFGKPALELAGRSASGLFPKEHLQRMKQVYIAREASYEEHLLDGHPKWMATAMTRHDHGIAITELDITLHKEADFQQQKLMRQLESSNEMVESLAAMKEYVQQRGAFLRTSFHDLRGSFGIIIGATTLLNMLDSQQERDKVLEMIQRNLTQISQLMNQLLDYSRLESGEEKLHIAPFDAAALLKSLCEGSRTLADEKGLYLTFKGPESLNADGDYVKVSRIAQNLILNALKYTVNGGVTVTWHLIGRDQDSTPHWELTISDTGPGLPKASLSKMNGETGQGAPQILQAQANTEGHGEGIGLFIVKKLCELLKAKMRVTSQEGIGTTFYITLPISYEADTAEQ
jgi:two-component system CheB/CheR fusion protein